MHRARRHETAFVEQELRREVRGHDDGVDQRKQRAGDGIARVARADRPDVDARCGHGAALIGDRDLGRARTGVDRVGHAQPRNVRPQRKLCRAQSGQVPHGKRLDAVLRPGEAVAPERGGDAGRCMHAVDRALMSAFEPLIRRLQRGDSGALVDDARAVERARRHPQRLGDVGRGGTAPLLGQRGHEAGGQPGRVWRRHTGAALDLIADVPAGDAGERDAGSHDVRLCQLAAARTEPPQHVTRGRDARLRRRGEHAWVARADRECQVG